MNLPRRRFLQALPFIPSAFLNVASQNPLPPLLAGELPSRASPPSGEELIAKYREHNEPAYIEFILDHVTGKILSREVLQYLDILTNYFMPNSGNFLAYEPDFKIYYLFKGEPLYPDLNKLPEILEIVKEARWHLDVAKPYNQSYVQALDDAYATLLKSIREEKPQELEVGAMVDYLKSRPSRYILFAINHDSEEDVSIVTRILSALDGSLNIFLEGWPCTPRNQALIRKFLDGVLRQEDLEDQLPHISKYRTLLAGLQHYAPGVQLTSAGHLTDQELPSGSRQADLFLIDSPSKGDFYEGGLVNGYDYYTRDQLMVRNILKEPLKTYNIIVGGGAHFLPWNHIYSQLVLSIPDAGPGGEGFPAEDRRPLPSEQIVITTDSLNELSKRGWKVLNPTTTRFNISNVSFYIYHKGEDLRVVDLQKRIIF